MGNHHIRDIRNFIDYIISNQDAILRGDIQIDYDAKCIICAKTPDGDVDVFTTSDDEDI